MAHSEVSEVLTIWGEESLDHSANETTAELETSSTGLTKQQIKNKKKRDAKKKKKQLHSQNMVCSDTFVVCPTARPMAISYKLTWPRG